MGRPGRQHAGLETIRYTRDRWKEATIPQMTHTARLGTRQKLRWNSSHLWSYRYPNGVQDPLTFMLVLDALLMIDGNLVLRASALTDWLNKESPQLRWDSIVVGRVLSDLYDGFSAIIGPKNGLLESSRDSKSRYYTIHHWGEAVELAWELREELMALTEIEMRVRARGGKTDFMGSPLLECKTMRGGRREGFKPRTRGAGFASEESSLAIQTA